MKRLALAFALLSITSLTTTPTNAGYYGYQYNWNPYHPWHSWHAPRPYYGGMYRWGLNRGNGWGRCSNPYRCGW